MRKHKLKHLDKKTKNSRAQTRYCEIFQKYKNVENTLKYVEYSGRVPLHDACQEGYADIVNLLLETSGDTTVNITNKYGDTPVDKCCEGCRDRGGKYGRDCSKSCSIIQHYVKNNNINID